MAIKKQLTDYSPIPPVESNRRLIGPPIAQHFESGSEAPWMPEEKSWRGSMAGSCARQIAYSIKGVEETNLKDASDYWRFWLGSATHAELFPAMKEWANNSEGLTITEEMEVTLGENGYGHIDLVLDVGDKKVVIELKTINGTGYKKAIGGGGPRYSALLQGSLYANGIDADLLVIAYVAMENCTDSWVEQRGFDALTKFTSEWHYTPDQFNPRAEAEVSRMEWITEQLNDGREAKEIPRMFSEFDPDIPWGAEVIDPRTGAWVLEQYDTLIAKSRTWMCAYCSYKDRCIQDG